MCPRQEARLQDTEVEMVSTKLKKSRKFVSKKTIKNGNKNLNYLSRRLAWQ